MAGRIHLKKSPKQQIRDHGYEPLAAPLGMILQVRTPRKTSQRFACRACPKVDGPDSLCPVGVGQGTHDKGYNKIPQKTCQFVQGNWLTWATVHKKNGRHPREQFQQKLYGT